MVPWGHVTLVVRHTLGMLALLACFAVVDIAIRHWLPASMINAGILEFMESVYLLGVAGFWIYSVLSDLFKPRKKGRGIPPNVTPLLLILAGI